MYICKKIRRLETLRNPRNLPPIHVREVISMGRQEDFLTSHAGLYANPLKTHKRMRVFNTRKVTHYAAARLFRSLNTRNTHSSSVLIIQFPNHSNTGESSIQVNNGFPVTKAKILVQNSGKK